MIFDELARLQRQRKRLSRTFDPLIAKAQKEKRQEDLQGLLSEFFFERDLINDTINCLETRRLQSKAEDLGIPVPRYEAESESWQKGFQPNVVFLSDKARHELSCQIREEKRQRREEITAWIRDLLLPVITVLAMVIGIISAARSCGVAR